MPTQYPSDVEAINDLVEKYKKLRIERYASFDSGKGKEFEEGKFGLEDLRNYAVSRIYLDNFRHIKAYWPMIGRTVASLSQAFGVDDMDGTIDDSTKIYSLAGSEEQTPVLTTEQLTQLIRSSGRTPVERDTLYNVVKEYTSEEVVES